MVAVTLQVTTEVPGDATGIVYVQVFPDTNVMATGPTAAPLLYVMVAAVMVPAVDVKSAFIVCDVGTHTPDGTVTFAESMRIEVQA